LTKTRAPPKGKRLAITKVRRTVGLSFPLQPLAAQSPQQNIAAREST